MIAESSAGPVMFRRLTGSDVVPYRDLRIEGLRTHPTAFGALWEDEASQPLTWFAERLEHSTVLAAGSHAGSALAGVVGLQVPDAAKLRHKGIIWGMFVRPEVQGMGVGAALLDRILDHAAHVVEEVRLTVVASNAAAMRLYSHAGFKEYGLERRALKVDGSYHDEVMMTLAFSRPR